MSIFDSPHQKWIKQKTNTIWNRMFTGFDEYDTMVTKLIVYKSVLFSDNLLSSEIFRGSNLELRAHTILLAKIQFFHLVTKSSLVHNMFYGYIYELRINHYNEDIETVNLLLNRLHYWENWYLTWYYNFYEDSNGSFIPVIKEYCKNVSKISAPDEGLLLKCTAEELHQKAAKLLMDMQISFVEEVRF